MNAFEQTLLFAATIVVLAGTTVVVAMQLFRRRGDGDK